VKGPKRQARPARFVLRRKLGDDEVDGLARCAQRLCLGVGNGDAQRFLPAHHNFDCIKSHSFCEVRAPLNAERSHAGPMACECNRGDQPAGAICSANLSLSLNLVWPLPLPRLVAQVNTADANVYTRSLNYAYHLGSSFAAKRTR
jgi:hypothetical protein